MFCSKCGADIKQGNKFCVKCGTPAQEINNGLGNIRIIGSESKGSQNNSSEELMNIVCDVLKKPLSTISNIEKFNQTMAFILVGIVLIAGALSSVVSLYRGTFGLINLLGDLAKAGYATIIFTSIIAQIISIALMTLVVWLFTKDKGSMDSTYGSSFELVMYALIPKIFMITISIIVNLIMPSIGIKLVGLAGIATAIILYKLLRYKKYAEPDKALLIVLVTMIF